MITYYNIVTNAVIRQKMNPNEELWYLNGKWNTKKEIESDSNWCIAPDYDIGTCMYDTFNKTNIVKHDFYTWYGYNKKLNIISISSIDIIPNVGPDKRFQLIDNIPQNTKNYTITSVLYPIGSTIDEYGLKNTTNTKPIVFFGVDKNRLNIYYGDGEILNTDLRKSTITSIIFNNKKYKIDGKYDERVIKRILVTDDKVFLKLDNKDLISL